MFSPIDFIKRRQKLMNLIPLNKVNIVIHGRKMLKRSHTIPIPVSQTSDMLYLTGYERNDGMLIICKDGNKNVSKLFLPPPSKEEEFFGGFRTKFDDAKKISGVDSVLPICDINDHLDALRGEILCSFPPHQSVTHSFKPLGPYIDLLKVIKSPQEIELIKRASMISIEGHKEVHSLIKPGMTEKQAEYIFLKKCVDLGATGFAYPVIAASGSNALCLHYIENNCKIKDGTVFKMDAGCEFHHYSSDITTTIPIGKIPKMQMDAIEMTRMVKDNLVRMAKEHQFVSLEHIHYTSENMFIKYLKEFNIDVSRSDLRRIYKHACSHFIGIDVHDCDSLPFNHKLERGNVFSIEPGLHFSPDCGLVLPPDLVGLGCMFEDTVCLDHI